MGNNDNIRQSYSYGSNSPDYGPDENQRSESRVTKGFIPTPGQPFPQENVQSQGDSFEDMETVDTSFDEARVAPNYRDPASPQIKQIIDDHSSQGVNPEVETVYQDQPIEPDPFETMQDQPVAPEQFNQQMNYNQAQDMNNFQGQGYDMDQSDPYARPQEFGEEPYQEPVEPGPFEQMQNQDYVAQNYHGQQGYDQDIQPGPFEAMQDQPAAPEQFNQQMNYNQAQDMNNFQGQGYDMDQSDPYARPQEFGEEPYQEPVEPGPFEQMQNQDYVAQDHHGQQGYDQDIQPGPFEAMQDQPAAPEQFNQQMNYNQAQDVQYSQPETHDPHHPEAYQQPQHAQGQYQQNSQFYDSSMDQTQPYTPPPQQGQYGQQGYAQQGQYGQQQSYQPYQQQQQYQQPQQHQPQPMYNAQHSGGGGGGMSTPIKILIGGVVLIGIILAILFGTGVLGGKKDKEPEPAAVETQETTQEEKPVVEEETTVEEEGSRWTTTSESEDATGAKETEGAVVDEEMVQDYQDSIEPSPYLKDDIGYFSEDETLVLNAFIPLVTQGLEGEVYTRVAILVYDVSLDDDFYGIVDADLEAMGIDPEVGEGTIGTTVLVIDDAELDFYVYRLYDEAGYGEEVASIDQLLDIYNTAVTDLDVDTNSAIDFEGIMAIFEHIINLQIGEVE